jgi:hypothetical protein
METFKVIMFEFILGYMLQGFAIVLGIYTFNKQEIILKDYILASGLVMIVSCLVRLLPISFGVHTIINMMLLFIICILMLKMPMYTTLRSMSLITILLLLFEMVDVAVISSVVGSERFEELMQNPLHKSMIGVPANVLFMVFVVITNNLMKKKGDHHRNVSSLHG